MMMYATSARYRRNGRTTPHQSHRNQDHLPSLSDGRRRGDRDGRRNGIRRLRLHRGNAPRRVHTRVRRHCLRPGGHVQSRAADQTVTYMATASDTAGSYSISGVLTASGRDDRRRWRRNRRDRYRAAAAGYRTQRTRSFSSSTVEAGGTLDVTITAAGYGDTGLVTETLPEGFSYCPPIRKALAK